jgi:hypothetical protein
MHVLAHSPLFASDMANLSGVYFGPPFFGIV